MIQSYDQEDSDYIRAKQLIEAGYTLNEIQGETNKLFQFICSNNLKFSFSLDILQTDFRDKNIQWLIKYSEQYYSTNINKNAKFDSIKFNRIPYENEYQQSVQNYELTSIEYFTHLFPIYFTTDNKLITLFIKDQKQQKTDAKSFKFIQTTTIQQVFLEYIKNVNKQYGPIALVVSGQKNYLDVNKSLIQSKVIDGSLIDIVSLDNSVLKQLQDYYIIDVKQIPKKITFIQKEPQYRIVDKGLNIEGFCKNKSCNAYQKLVIYNTGIGVFDLIKNRSMINCPECKQYFKPIQCGFTLCSYNIFAKYIDDDDGETKFLQPTFNDVSGNYYYKYIFQGKDQQITFLQFTIYTEDLKMIPQDNLKQNSQQSCFLCTTIINSQEKQLQPCQIHTCHQQCMQEIKESKFIIFEKCPSCERSG